MTDGTDDGTVWQNGWDRAARQGHMPYAHMHALGSPSACDRGRRVTGLPLGRGYAWRASMWSMDASIGTPQSLATSIVLTTTRLRFCWDE